MFFFIGFLLSMLTLNAQNIKYANSIWEFGQYARIDFNEKDSLIVGFGRNAVGEGSATYRVDESTFYTCTGNFLKLKRSNHRLQGSSSTTQSCLFIPKPGNSRFVYLFTLDEKGGNLNYTVIDTINGGSIVVGKKDVFLRGGNDEKLAGCFHGNNKDFWIVVHGKNSSDFYVYRLTGAGLLPNPQKYSIGQKHTGGWDVAGTKGYMKFSSNKKFLAVAVVGEQAVKATKSGFVELLDFNPWNGKISNARTVGTSELTLPTFLKGKNLNGVYGLEFSENSKMLYACQYRYGSEVPRIIQFDLNASNNAIALASNAHEVFTYPYSSGNGHSGMALGNDGKIYVAINGTNYLSVINNPNCKGIKCNYEDEKVFIGDPWDNSSGVAGWGMPNFIKPYLEEAKYSYKNAVTSNDSFCLGDSIRFLLDSPINDLFRWFVTDGNKHDTFNNVDSIDYRFLSNGPHRVELNIGRFNALNCSYGNYSFARELDLPNHKLTLTDTSVCEGDNFYYTYNTKGKDLNYLWDDGSTDGFRNVSYPTDKIWLKTVNKNCVKTDTAKIYYNKLINLPYSFSVVHSKDSSNFFCSSDSLLFWINQKTNRPIEWYVNDGLFKDTISNKLSFNYKFHTTSDSVSVKLKVGNDQEEGCYVIKEYSQKLRFYNPYFKLRDTVLCSGEELNLKLFPQSNSHNLIWNNGSKGFVANYSHPTDTINYRSVEGSCLSNDTMLVSYRAVPAYKPIKDTVTCSSPATFIEQGYNNNNKIKWNRDSLSTEKFKTYLSSGTYSIEYEDSFTGCKSYDTFNLTIKPLPTIIGLNDIRACAREKWAHIPTSNKLYKYTWGNGSSIDSILLNSSTNQTTVTYEDRLTGCIKIDTFITDLSYIDGAADLDTSLLPNICYRDISIGSISSRWWMFKSDSLDWRNNLHDHQVLETSSELCFNRKVGCYFIAMETESSEGCLDTTIQEYCFFNKEGIVVYNTFTPNGDGLNDIWLLENIGSDHYSLSIFNRYGTLVFKTNNAQEGWDGKINGTAVNASSGTYYYNLEYGDGKDKKENISGVINLIR